MAQSNVYDLDNVPFQYNNPVWAYCRFEVAVEDFRGARHCGNFARWDGKPEMNSILNAGRSLMHHPIARRQLMRTIWRIVRWQYLSRTQQVVPVEWIEGAKLSVSRGDKGATGNLYFGLHEFASMAFALHLLRPGDLFIDGGANIGSYTLLASVIAGAQTAAFEPDPETAGHLARHVRINGIESLTTLHETALGDRSDTVSFTTGLATMNRVEGGGQQRVPMIPLDSLELAPSLIKLDLEGGEIAALKGAARTLEQPNLLAVICEDNAPATAQVFAEIGFNRFRYAPFERLLEPEPRALWENGIFIRDIEAVRTRVVSAAQVSVYDELV